MQLYRERLTSRNTFHVTISIINTVKLKLVNITNATTLQTPKNISPNRKVRFSQITFLEVKEERHKGIDVLNDWLTD